MNGFNNITHLSFDCYGTLIDWEAGILRSLQDLLQAHGLQVDAETILRSYVTHEAELETGDWHPYRQILREVSIGVAQEFGVALSGSEPDRLPNSIGSWPPFDDTVSALRQLKSRFRLVILSNVDDALFAQTAKQLNIPFDEVITAEQLRSYKPADAHFREALGRLNVPVSQILHVAQSLYHDHI